MQKYIKNDLSDIRYFEDEVKGCDWLDLTQYRLMTEAEIIKHESNPNNDHHVWDESLLKWVDNRMLEEITEYERSLLPPLTKRQLSLYLFDIGKHDEVMDALNANPRFKIEFETTATIERSSPPVIAMSNLLGWTDEWIDKMWREALTL